MTVAEAIEILKSADPNSQITAISIYRGEGEITLTGIETGLVADKHHDTLPEGTPYVFFDFQTNLKSKD